MCHLGWRVGALIGRCCSGLFSGRLEKVRLRRGEQWAGMEKMEEGWARHASLSPLSSLHFFTSHFNSCVRLGVFFRRMKAGRKLPTKTFKEKCISHAELCCTIFPYGMYPKKGHFSDSGCTRKQCSLQRNYSFCYLPTVEGILVSGSVLGAAWRDPCFWVASLSEILCYLL